MEACTALKSLMGVFQNCSPIWRQFYGWCIQHTLFVGALALFSIFPLFRYQLVSTNFHVSILKPWNKCHIVLSWLFDILKFLGHFQYLEKYKYLQSLHVDWQSGLHILPINIVQEIGFLTSEYIRCNLSKSSQPSKHPCG